MPNIKPAHNLHLLKACLNISHLYPAANKQGLYPSSFIYTIHGIPNGLHTIVWIGQASQGRSEIKWQMSLKDMLLIFDKTRVTIRWAKRRETIYHTITLDLFRNNCVGDSNPSTTPNLIWSQELKQECVKPDKSGAEVNVILCNYTVKLMVIRWESPESVLIWLSQIPLRV